MILAGLHVAMMIRCQELLLLPTVRTGWSRTVVLPTVGIHTVVLPSWSPVWIRKNTSPHCLPVEPHPRPYLTLASSPNHFFSISKMGGSMGVPSWWANCKAFLGPVELAPVLRVLTRRKGAQFEASKETFGGSAHWTLLYIHKCIYIYIYTCNISIYIYMS